MADWKILFFEMLFRMGKCHLSNRLDRFTRLSLAIQYLVSAVKAAWK